MSGRFDQPFPVPTTRVREQLRSVFRTDADFVAFVLDHFPEAYQRMGDGMDRVSKENLLIAIVSPDAITHALQYSTILPIRTEGFHNVPCSLPSAVPGGSRQIRDGHHSRLAILACTLTCAVGAVWLTHKSARPTQPRLVSATTPDAATASGVGPRLAPQPEAVRSETAGFPAYTKSSKAAQSKAIDHNIKAAKFPAVRRSKDGEKHQMSAQELFKELGKSPDDY